MEVDVVEGVLGTSGAREEASNGLSSQGCFNETKELAALRVAAVRWL